MFVFVFVEGLIAEAFGEEAERLWPCSLRFRPLLAVLDGPVVIVNNVVLAFIVDESSRSRGDEAP